MNYQDFSQSGRWWLAKSEGEFLAIDLALVCQFKFSTSVNGEFIRVYFTYGEEIHLSDECAVSLRDALLDYISKDMSELEEAELDFFYV